MKVRGLVAGVRDGSWTAKDGKHFEQWSVDLYDDTAGILNCQMPKNGVNVVPGTKVEADVTRVRKIPFGDGFQLALSNVREVADMPAPLPFVPAGAATTPPASTTSRSK